MLKNKLELALPYRGGMGEAIIINFIFLRYIDSMKKISLIIISMIIAMTNAMAQERTVENRPYTDLRPFHFGVLVGSHLQDLELQNVGPYTIVNEDGTQNDVFISADQDRFDAGFNVGVLGELRLTQHLQFRVAPAMYFGSRRLMFPQPLTLSLLHHASIIIALILCLELIQC